MKHSRSFCLHMLRAFSRCPFFVLCFFPKRARANFAPVCHRKTTSSRPGSGSPCGSGRRASSVTLTPSRSTRAWQLATKCVSMAVSTWRHGHGLHNLWRSHFGVDEHPCATYFDDHQGYRVLTHSHILAYLVKAAHLQYFIAWCMAWK